MRKKVGFILLGISLAVLAIGGGTWHYLEQAKQDKKEEAVEKREEKKLIQKSAREIDDFYKWNYIGVKKTKTGKLWTNTASGEFELDYTVYLEKGRKDTFSAEWDKENKIVLVQYAKKMNPRPSAKISETLDYTISSERYLLSPSDIRKLKQKGFSKNITGFQIKEYIRRMYPQKFEEGEK